MTGQKLERDAEDDPASADLTEPTVDSVQARYGDEQPGGEDDQEDQRDQAATKPPVGLDRARGGVLKAERIPAYRGCSDRSSAQLGLVDVRGGRRLPPAARRRIATATATSVSAATASASIPRLAESRPTTAAPMP